MTDLQVFQNQSFGEVRTMVRDGEPWFVATDVCRSLELDPTATRRLDDDEKITLRLTQGESQRSSETTIISEPGLYTLILGSRKPEARAFKRWITHDVIPAIRKTGAYTMDSSVEASRLRARAMLLNAQTRQLGMIIKTIADKRNLAPLAIEVFGLKTIQAVFGTDVGGYLPETERTLSATQVADMYGVTAARVGRLANLHGLKTPEFGIFVLDKSPYSAKEVEAFRYNQHGVERIGQILVDKQ